MEVRSAIKRINRLASPPLRLIDGLRRNCTAGAMQVNHKRVARIMREDNLLGMQPARFVVTTNSNHKLESIST